MWQVENTFLSTYLVEFEARNSKRKMIVFGQQDHAAKNGPNQQYKLIGNHDGASEFIF